MNKDNLEPKIIPGGLEGAMKRFLELGRSYEQHLQMKMWQKDEGLSRAATLMDRIAASADRHRAKMNGLMENMPSKNPQDTLRDIFRK